MNVKIELNHDVRLACTPKFLRNVADKMEKVLEEDPNRCHIVEKVAGFGATITFIADEVNWKK